METTLLNAPTMTTTINNKSSKELASDLAETMVEQVCQSALDMKAEDVLKIDVRHLSSYTDFIVLASGTSDKHVQSIAQNVYDKMKKSGQSILGSEGLKQGQWSLIDCGEVVFHCFHQFTREVYNLEDLWKDAPQTPVLD